MGETSEKGATEVKNWKGIGSELNMTRLDDLESGRLSIRCVNSSEFVVGKQTSFNGPVTIINCARVAALEKENPEDRETIVIRDQVLSRSAALTLEEKAEQLGKDSVDSMDSKKDFLEKWRLGVKSCIFKNMLAIPVAVFVVLAVATGITLALFYLRQDVAAKEKSERICIELENLESKSCIYSVPPEAAMRCKNSRTAENPLQTPFSYVAISETKGEHCFFPDQCFEILQFDNCEGGLGCNFLVGSDGNVLEILGWNERSVLEGFPPGGSLLVCLIGDFDYENYPTYPQLEATKSLIAFGVEKDFVSSDYVLWAANATSRNGNSNNVYRVIKKWPKFTPELFPFSGERPIQTPEDPFLIYSREDWGAEPPTSVIKMKLPLPYVVVSHSVTPECRDLHSCSPRIQSMQSYHFSKNMADIAYSFLLDSGGNVYEGRGWTIRSGKMGFVNGRNINVCFIGDFSRNTKPTEKQFEALESLIEYGVAKGKISKDYSLISDNSTYATLSPGKMVYGVIKDWPHFDPDPKSNIKNYDD